MKKHFLFFASLAVVAMMSFTSCEQKGKSSGKDDEGGNTPAATGEVINEKLSPEDNKEHLMKIAKQLIGKFNTADQKAAIKMADDLVQKYQEYSWTGVENYFENKYEPIFSMPRYAADVAAGRKSPASFMETVYTFSFANDKAIFEADDNERRWVYAGTPTEDCVILRCTDSNGKKCEAKVWGEGTTKTAEFTYEDGRTWKGVLPSKVIFTLKQGNSEYVRVTVEQDVDINKLNRVHFDATVKVCNIQWITNVNMDPTSGSCAYKILYGNDELISAMFNLPSYQLIAKESYQDYEDWINQYSSQYEYLISQIGSADAIVDVLRSVQVKVNVNNFGTAYEQFKQLDYYSGVAREQALCNLINDNQTNGVYYNSETKQAEVQMTMSQDYYGDYYAEPVLYFMQDGSTYAFEQYFDNAFYSELMQMVEDLANAYIKISDLLYNAVGGEVHFN